MIALAFIIVLVSSSAFAWDGYDSESGGYVEIGKGNLVRSGQTIDVYDHNAGEYRDVDVVGIRDAGGSVEVEVYDDEAGEYRTLDMEKD
ncbi:MAG TPA: hypothetical protein DCG34_06460 [Clostridiales bacterium]|nr:hypothetical protein [Clostridiales bacterium]